MSIIDPYRAGNLITYNEGDESLERSKIIHIPDINDRLYIVKEEDRLDNIAFKFYGNSHLWFLIADVNDNIIDPFELPPGTSIIIPNIELYNFIR